MSPYPDRKPGCLQLIVALIALLAACAQPVTAPRSGGNDTSQAGASTEARASLQSGAPQAVVVTALPTPSAAGVGAPTPRPSGGIGKPASYCKPGYCETPTPALRGSEHAGEATWWYSFGPGIYAALRPDLGSKGDMVIVCGGEPFHCVTAPVITSCACLGPNSDRLVDLSADLFREFAPLSAGVVRITLQVVTR